jgi:prepilin-type N-terminal cleavage/methylation domain-containing protein
MRRTRAFTLIELLVVISIIALLIGILLPALGAARKTANQMKNTSQLRGQHQGCIIYAQSNASYLPGYATNGVPVTAGYSTTGNPSADGTVAGSRYWILLNGSFISPQLLLNPQDALTVWSTNSVLTSNHSYAMLSVTAAATDSGRIAEWKDNANGAAVLISDRNIGSDNTNTNIKSLWVTSTSQWRGSAIWGDNHGSFELSNSLSTTTIYNATSQTNDDLFATGTATGIVDNSTVSTANAYMTVTN